MEKQPGIYHSFVFEADLVNGHMHYTSQDETMALTYNTGTKQWYIQEAEKRCYLKKHDFPTSILHA